MRTVILGLPEDLADRLEAMPEVERNPMQAIGADDSGRQDCIPGKCGQRRAERRLGSLWRSCATDAARTAPGYPSGEKRLIHRGVRGRGDPE